MAAATQKKKSTAPARKSPPPERTPRPRGNPAARIAGGILCLLFALCTAVSYFGVEGLVLVWLRKILCGLLGYGYWLFGAALLCAGIALLLHRQGRVALQVTAALLAPLFMGTVLHLVLCPAPEKLSLESIRPLWAEGQALRSGGVIAGALADAGELLMSKIVSLIVFGLLFALAVIAALRWNPVEAWKRRREAEEWEEVPEEAPAAKPGKPRAAAPEEPAPRSARRPVTPAVFDIPLDGEDRSVEPPEQAKALRPSKKKLFADKDENLKTPAEVWDPAAKPAPAAPEEPAAQPAAVPTPAAKKQQAAAEVEAAAQEVSAEIERELSGEEPAYRFPPVDLLEENRGTDSGEAGAELRSNAARLSSTLRSFGVDARPGEVIRGPSVTRYEFTLDQGVKLSKITNLQDDIALALGASGVRIAPVPGKIASVGIEVPNRHVTPVCIRDVIASDAFRHHPSSVAFAVGKDIGGSCVVGNIAKLPHVLIAGTTGSGKSVCTNSLIVSLLYKSSPEDVRFIMVDPKMVELAPYNGIPHLLIPVVTDPKKAAGALQWAVFEMMKRYKLFSEHGVKDLAGYNALAQSSEELKKMPTVVVVIDELADLMLVAAKEVEESICRVAQMGRAAGMHLVIATQRPSADVITGLMKANIPSRIAFAVASSMESRIILDTAGAEKLIGRGDMLYFPLGDSKPTRVQGCFISPEEIERVVAFVKETGETNYDQSVIDKIDEALEKSDKSKGDKGAAAANEEPAGEYDEMLCAAVEVILETGQASVSMLQRRLKLGYSRAARLVDQMEEKGIVGPFEGSKPRRILVDRAKWQEMLMQSQESETPAKPHDPYGSISDVFESRDALE